MQVRNSSYLEYVKVILVFKQVESKECYNPNILCLDKECMLKKIEYFILFLALTITLQGNLYAQKYTSGLIVEGFIDVIIIDTTEQAFAEATFFKENASKSDPNKYIFFNYQYQIEIDTINSDEYVRNYLDIESGLKYKYYDATSSKLLTIDSFVYDFRRDVEMKRLMDSTRIVFAQMKNNSPKILIDGFQCSEIEPDKINKGEEGYFKMYVTDEIGIKYVSGRVRDAIDGYILKMRMSISKECDIEFGVKSIRYIDPIDEIFVRPTNGYKTVSIDEFNEVVFLANSKNK